MESRTGETGMFTIWDVMGTPHAPIASESSRKILPFFFLFAYGPSTTRGQEEHKTSHHQSQPSSQLAMYSSTLPGGRHILKTTYVPYRSENDIDMTYFL